MFGYYVGVNDCYKEIKSCTENSNRKIDAICQYLGIKLEEQSGIKAVKVGAGIPVPCEKGIKLSNSLKEHIKKVISELAEEAE